MRIERRGQVVFPYETLQEASKDKYKKIGGPSNAFRYMQKGYKAIEWRKRANENVKRELEEERLRFDALQNRHVQTQGSKHIKQANRKELRHDRG